MNHSIRKYRHSLRPKNTGSIGRWVALFLLLLPVSAVARETKTGSDKPLDKEAQELSSRSIPPLPEAIASFGAAVAGDHLYVYGGHIGKTHAHSIENLSHRFRRLDLTKVADGWQDLGAIQGLQGLPMVAYGDQVCRVGGLSALNHQDAAEEDLVSVADVACFDPQNGGWRALPPLPHPRSSHDAAVLGDHLYVVGGWQLQGAGTKPVWHEKMAVLDLKSANPAWQTLPQSFQRRALAVAAAGGKLFAFGGLGQEGTSRAVEIFDPATESWASGPELPAMAQRMKGFGVSAFGVGNTVYLSGADGVIHALEEGANGWQRGMARLDTPRFFHRLLPHRERLLFVGGASRSGHLNSIESVVRADLKPGAIPPPQPAPDKEAEGVSAAKKSWPSFRGDGNGHAHFADLPVSWSEKENIAWRAPLPGIGQSAPVQWDGQIFVTSVEGPMKETLILSALALESGEVRWRRRFSAGQEVESSEMVSRGAPTPVVDGSRVYAFWESGDLIALNHAGETLWRRSLTQEYGEFVGNHGIASSPVLTEDAIVVQVTHDGPSYYLAIDKASGQNRWKVERPAKTAWTTPVVVGGKDGQEILISAAGRVEALHAKTGELLWSFEEIEKNHVPSVVVSSDLVVAASSEPGQSLALQRGDEGKLQEGKLLWRAQGVSSGFGSPIIHQNCVLFVNKAGVATCLDPADGRERWKHRLAESCWASPIATEDHVYFFTKKGTTVIVKPGADGPEVVAQNVLPTEDTVYGVAAAPGALLIRTGNEVVRVGATANQPQEEVALEGANQDTEEKASDR